MTHGENSYHAASGIRQLVMYKQAGVQHSAVFLQISPTLRMY